MGSGYSTGMDLRLILANIDWRLKMSGMTDNEASNLAKSPDAIRNIRRKVAGELTGGITMRTLEKLAGALDCRATDLLQPPPEENVRPIPGLKEQLFSQLEYLNSERERVLRQLHALEAAETALKKPARRKNR